MMMNIARNIEWSPEKYTVRELMEYCSMPLVAMVRQGHCALREEDSLSQGQIIRIARINIQKRVLAKDAKNRKISIPLDCPFNFEVMKNKSGSLRGTFRKLKKMTLNDLVRNYTLPLKVRLPSRLHHDPSVLNLIGIDLITGPIDLERLEEEIFLQGNAVNFGELDTTVINIPDHSDLEVSIALGARDGKHALFKKLENSLADRVAKDVRFGNASDATAIKRLVQIGAEIEPTPRTRASSSVRGSMSDQDGGSVALPDRGRGEADGESTGRYQKHSSKYKRPSLSAIERRMKENNPPQPPTLPISNGKNVFHFDNAAFDITDIGQPAAEQDVKANDDDDDLPEPAVWTEIKLEGDEDLDVAPPKDLFTKVSSFSFHNPSTWGFNGLTNNT